MRETTSAGKQGELTYARVCSRRRVSIHHHHVPSGARKKKVRSFGKKTKSKTESDVFTRGEEGKVGQGVTKGERDQHRDTGRFSRRVGADVGNANRRKDSPNGSSDDNIEGQRHLNSDARCGSLHRQNVQAAEGKCKTHTSAVSAPQL